MESSSFDLQIHEPSQSVLHDCPLSDFFYINFEYTCVTLPSRTNIATVSISDLSATTNEILLIPSEILCSCNELSVLEHRDHNTIILHDTFISMPICPYILDQILPQMGEYARRMIARDGEERRNIWEMDVTLHVWILEDDDDDGHLNQRASLASQLVDLCLEKVIGTDHDDPASPYSTEQCTICLEEFCSIGSKSELVYSTKCLHLFHKECIVKWLQQCIKRQSAPYTCPVCRCQITI